MSERDAQTHAASLHHATVLAGRAVENLETARQIDGLQQLQAGAASGIIDENAIDHVRLRAGEDLDAAGHSALGLLARV